MKDDKNCNSANHVKLGNLDFEVLGTEIKLTVQNENGEGKLQYLYSRNILFKTLHLEFFMQLGLRDFLENLYQKFWEYQIIVKKKIFA